MSRRKGQATIEYALSFAAIVMPLMFMIIFTAELLWVWHSIVDFTREGARYATTHCWQGSGDNVISYMRTNVPAMIDDDQFRQGPAEIAVQYFSRDPDSGTLTEFACEGSPCSTECVPDTVTIRIENYEFRRFMSFLGLPPVALPDFHTSLPMESAGCDPEQAQCLP
jgi:hypothetical protein